MVWEQRAASIVMMTRLEEKSRVRTQDFTCCLISAVLIVWSSVTYQFVCDLEIQLIHFGDYDNILFIPLDKV